MPTPGLTIRGPRSLLRQIREAMAGGGPVQSRLDMAVRIIAGSMVAEVCSLYLRRATGDLELFATEGLSPGAVHVTRLKPGEGLVGEIVRLGRPLNLSDAPSHRAFAYRPETGEDPYHAFLGVPQLRGGRTIGVLVVQNRTERVYGEEEVEDLQIIAMVLAEMVAGGELIAQGALKDVEIAPNRPERLKGVRFAEGLAYGVAVLHETPVAPEQLLSDDSAAEEKRLQTAVSELQVQIDHMMDGQHGLVGASFEVLETYRMFAHDRGWNRSLEEAVRSGLTAEAAVERVRSEHRARLGQARDPYLRERLHDLEDLNDRLLRHLSGNGGSVSHELPENAILIARNLGPADILEYDRTRLAGILLEEGSAASHAGIVARALDIPCVGRLAGLRDRVWPRHQPRRHRGSVASDGGIGLGQRGIGLQHDGRARHVAGGQIGAAGKLPGLAHAQIGDGGGSGRGVAGQRHIGGGIGGGGTGAGGIMAGGAQAGYRVAVAGDLAGDFGAGQIDIGGGGNRPRAGALGIVDVVGGFIGEDAGVQRAPLLVQPRALAEQIVEAARGERRAAPGEVGGKDMLQRLARGFRSGIAIGQLDHRAVDRAADMHVPGNTRGLSRHGVRIGARRQVQRGGIVGHLGAAQQLHLDIGDAVGRHRLFEREFFAGGQRRAIGSRIQRQQARLGAIAGAHQQRGQQPGCHDRADRQDDGAAVVEDARQHIAQRGGVHHFRAKRRWCHGRRAGGKGIGHGALRQGAVLRPALLFFR